MCKSIFTTCLTPAEGSDLEIGLSDPSAGVARVFYTYLYTQVVGTACLDLCLFSTDLCRGPPRSYALEKTLHLILDLYPAKELIDRKDLGEVLYP